MRASSEQTANSAPAAARVEDSSRAPLNGRKTSSQVVGAALDVLLAALHTSASGLSSADAELRRPGRASRAAAASRGHFEVIVAFRHALADPLVLILLVAGAASAFLGERTNAGLIGAIVLSSAGINAWQTLRSDRAVRALQAKIAPLATVLRDGAWRELPRGEIVSGDVVRLSAGDLVPADARLLAATDLHVQQAALTGESLPVEKRPSAGTIAVADPHADELVFLGTSVVSGTAQAVVFAVGAATAFGDVLERLAARPAETEFERGTRRFGLLILKTVFFLVFFILVVNIAEGRNALESVLFSVALAVGLTPEFLPMITTVTLARGALEMSRQKVIVKHLQAIQNLGSIDVLCSDKTGTLTSGRMSLDVALDPLGQRSERALELAAINSQHQSGLRSPLDEAIVARAAAHGDLIKVGEIPFDFERRRLSVIVRQGADLLLIIKGAPESVLGVCTAYEAGSKVAALDPTVRKSCLATFESLSREGFRVLAVAYRRPSSAPSFRAADERELTLAGFLTFADHPLADASAALAALRRDGVVLKVLTGDNELVTGHVCREVGLDVGTIVLGQDIERLDEGALARVAEEHQVFARMSPAQKHRLICALQTRNHVVGYLGDGINDAPSLHAADVGISVAGAVDVAREASDIILLEQGLAVLHAGILAGRRSFGNVLKYLLMGTSSNFGNMFSMAGAALFLPFLPMLPTQILLNNFLYDLAQLTIPSDAVDPAIVAQPQRWDIRLIRRFMLSIGPLSSVYDFLTFFVLLRVFRFEESAFHTGWFLESLATQTLVIFVIRTTGRAWRSRPSRPLIASTVLVVAIGMILPYTRAASWLGFEPLPASFGAFLLLIVGSYLGIVEAVKRALLARLQANSSSTTRS